jgi:hypothetical protein
MAGFAAFDQAQSAVGDETAHGPTGGVGGEASTAGEPRQGEAELGPAFETAVPQEMTIDAALRDGQAQPGNELVIDLLPNAFSVGFFVFHGTSPDQRVRVRRLGGEKPTVVLRKSLQIALVFFGMAKKELTQSSQSTQSS